MANKDKTKPEAKKAPTTDATEVKVTAKVVSAGRKVPIAAPPVIIDCFCKHPWQDSKYGVGKRVANYGPSRKGNGGAGYVCTVCGRHTPY